MEFISILFPFLLYMKFLIKNVKSKTKATVSLCFVFVFFPPGNDFIASRIFKMASMMKMSCWQQKSAAFPF